MQNIPTGNNQQGQQGGNQKPSLSWQSPAPTSPQQKPLAMNTPSEKPKTPSTPAKKVEASKSSSSGYIGIFAAGLIVGVLLGWGIVSSRGGTPSTGSATSTPSTNTTSTSGTQSGTTSGGIDLSGAISGGPFSIATQDAGLAVAVTNINVTQPTWIVIYESNGGTLGRALGAHLFFPRAVGGESSGTIDLLRGTLPGQKYFAGQSLDDGDKIFSTENDKPVRDDKGNPVVAQFSTK